MLKGGKPITASSLFAFAKIALLHTETVLAGMGVRLEIVSICARTPPAWPRHQRRQQFSLGVGHPPVRLCSMPATPPF